MMYASLTYFIYKYYYFGHDVLIFPNTRNCTPLII